MINKMLIVATVVAALNPVNASTQRGEITNIQVRDDGLHWIYLNGSRTAKPECAANHAYWMIKDENSASGKSQFSMLLAAFMSKQTVTIIGTDSCSRWGDGEDIRIVDLR